MYCYKSICDPNPVVYLHIPFPLGIQPIWTNQKDWDFSVGSEKVKGFSFGYRMNSKAFAEGCWQLSSPVIWRKFICTQKNEYNTQKHSQEIKDGRRETE